MDYDLTDIPAAYDRGRDHGPETLELWMRTLKAHLQDCNVVKILDLGCGTGRFSEALAVYFKAEVAGIDPSSKMLERAREKQHDGRVQYQRGSAEAIPLPSASVDMIFMSMSFHHFGDRASAVRECRRALREQGVVFVRTGTREQIQAYPYVPFFPSSRAMIEELLPDRSELRESFERGGFRMTAWELITQTVAPSWKAYADKLSAGGDSIIARLSREELESGLAALRRHGAEGVAETIVEPIDLFVFR
jgi:ubiquinone/menaquinone biosynthesis C-methylase UbiE